MKRAHLLILLAAVACSSRAPAASPVASERPELAKGQMVLVTSPALSTGGPIARGYTAYGKNQMLPLSWSALPAGTQSIAVIVEDPDAPTPQPFVHWTAWNISPAARGLPQGLAGAVEGRNGTGGAGWFGPKPPDAKPHRYYFQLFALDTKLNLPASAGRDELVTAMTGHVLGKGRLLGVFVKPKG